MIIYTLVIPKHHFEQELINEMPTVHYSFESAYCYLLDVMGDNYVPDGLPWDFETPAHWN